MTSPIAPGYEFGEFVLLPERRVLTHLGDRVQINQRDFDILALLLANHDRVVTQKEIVESVWGPDARLADGNVSNHIAKIRKAIGCDPVHPKYIKTIRPHHGYRFLAPVRRVTDLNVSIESHNPSIRREGYGLTMHLFVPMYLGADSYQKRGGTDRQTEWAVYKEISIESGRLCLLTSDYGVWHIPLKDHFTKLSDFALARNSAYRKILAGKHVINACTRELADGSEDGEMLRSIVGKPGYVLSATVLQNTTAKRKETIRNILQVLSLPTSLETAAETRASISSALENKLLGEGMNPRGLIEFGIPGGDRGFASWDGVSYTSPSTNRTLENSIVEFEITLQGLWWECKSIVDLILTDDTPVPESVRSRSLGVERRLARLRNIGPIESPSMRSMTEAVIETSRIEQVVSELLRLTDRADR